MRKMHFKTLAGLAMTLLAACATPPQPGNRLPDGHYQLTSVNAAGEKVAGPTRIDIPFNDQSFVVGTFCVDETAVRVIATGANGQQVASFDCVRITNGQSPAAQAPEQSNSNNGSGADSGLVKKEIDPATLRELGMVVIDTSNPAYTVVIVVPKSSKGEIEKFAAKEASTFTYVAVDEFNAQPKKYLDGRVLVHSYPEGDFYKRFATLVTQYPANPFGLAFNGGIAITHNDYVHTERMYSVWTKDKQLYNEIQTLPENQPKDPINPESHFSGLLGAAALP